MFSGDTRRLLLIILLSQRNLERIDLIILAISLVDQHQLVLNAHMSVSSDHSLIQIWALMRKRLLLKSVAIRYLSILHVDTSAL